jgi:hypothetical protein
VGEGFCAKLYGLCREASCLMMVVVQSFEVLGERIGEKWEKARFCGAEMEEVRMRVCIWVWKLRNDGDEFERYLEPVEEI